MQIFGKNIRDVCLLWRQPIFENPVDLHVPVVLGSGSPPIDLAAVVRFSHESTY
jgi:hypothetical protein